MTTTKLHPSGEIATDEKAAYENAAGELLLPTSSHRNKLI